MRSEGDVEEELRSAEGDVAALTACLGPSISNWGTALRLLVIFFSPFTNDVEQTARYLHVNVLF